MYHTKLNVGRVIEGHSIITNNDSIIKYVLY